MTLDAWADLDEDVEGELVDGVLEEEEMPSVRHGIVVGWLIEVLRMWVRRRGGVVADSETKIAVGARRGRKPDVSVYLKDCLPRLDDALVRVAPHLVVEVLSPRPRDVRRDRVDKRRDYARAAIPNYWILDPQLRRLEVLALDRRGRYEVVLTATTGRTRVPGCPGLVLNLDALWGEIEEGEPAERRRQKRQ
jgi:Uma2 family endonuclease